jgi:copper chaperone CopZ
MSHVTLTLTVEGLSADPRCCEMVERTLAAADGVRRVYVSASIETVYVAYDPRITSPGQVAAALARAGVRAKNVRVTHA